MARGSDIKQLGWGNQPRVHLHPGGAFAAPGVSPPSVPLSDREALIAAGDALYRMASIVDDQVGNPFNEAKVSQSQLKSALEWIDQVLDACPTGDPSPLGASDLQCEQLRASGGVVLLSIAESQAGRKSTAAQALVQTAMELYFKRLEAETDPLLAERMVINLDWVVPSLPKALADRARRVMQERIPWTPPYDAWFAGGDVLRIDWKAGSEFLQGWIRRLQENGFTLVSDGGAWGDSELRREYQVGTNHTEVRMTIAAERSNVFRKMSDPDYHIVGYDGHSDWGRNIPRSLEHAPPQQGEKAIFYLLCCGKQILEKVRDVYPHAQVVTTFNSSRFTEDFKYSEDFSAFMNILDGIARRESWEQIRARVNKDWYNNPEKNYIFPTETLAMARSLDRDHDGQADMFDKLVDFNTFDVLTDALEEFSPRVPETPPQNIVGTRLHFAVQVFHTLAHFNQVLEGFTHDLRVFGDGWYDPNGAPAAGVIDRGPARIRVQKGSDGLNYFFEGSAHYAHATEEAWRAIAVLTLCETVMAREPAYKQLPPEERVLNGLVMVSQSLEVDDMPGRDEAIWRRLLPALELPVTIELATVRAARRVDAHWYAGSRASIAQLKKELPPAVLEALRAWAMRPS